MNKKLLSSVLISTLTLTSLSAFVLTSPSEAFGKASVNRPVLGEAIQGGIAATEVYNGGCQYDSVSGDLTIVVVLYNENRKSFNTFSSVNVLDQLATFKGRAAKVKATVQTTEGTLEYSIEMPYSKAAGKHVFGKILTIKGI